MRLFLGIEPSKTAKSILTASLVPIVKKYPDANWVPAENYHLSVFFIGEVPDDPWYLERLNKKIDKILFEQSSFYLYSSHLDLYMQQKIVMYLSFIREKKLEALVSLIQDSLPIHPEEKTYLPHITVAKTKIPSKQQYFLMKKTLERTRIDLEFQVKELILFESLNGGKNPVYNKLSTFPLL